MKGRGRGFLFKTTEDEKPTDDQSDLRSSASTFPILGRCGRGMRPSSQLISTQQSTDSRSDGDSGVSVFPSIGRGRGLLSLLGKGGTSSSESKSSETDPIKHAKQYFQGQFDDSTSKKVSSSSGRGRSSGNYDFFLQQ